MEHLDKTKEQLICELEESDEWYRAIHDKSPIAIELYDSTGALVQVNHSCLELFGVENIEKIKGFSLFADPNISEEHKEKLHRGENIRYQGPFDFEKVKTLNLYHTRREGIIWLDVLITPIGNSAELIKGFLVQIQDITDQKLNVEALHQTERKYERMVTNIQDVVYSVDGETGEYTYLSPVFGKLLGYTQNDIVRMGGRVAFLSKVLPAGKSSEHQDRFIQLHSQSMDQAVTDELWWRCKDGSLKCIADHWNPVYVGGRLVSTDGVLRDITERKQIDEALNELLVRAEASDRLKTAFLNNISHEVRTPLNGILGFAEILDDPGLSPEGMSFYKEVLHISSDRLLNTINSYMDISLIVSGNMSFSNSLFDLRELLGQRYNHFHDLAAAKGVSIKMDHSGDIGKIMLKSDPELIRKVLDHLLENAVKFTEYGSIIVGHRVLPDEIEVYVQDSGIGISEKLQEQIFDSFLQADFSNTRKHEGSGLGLAIAKGLIELLGGKIWVKSIENSGSTFGFSIPNISNLPVNPEKEVIEERQTHENNPVVLIAEDDQINILLLETMLRHSKAIVWHVENGKLAVDCCRNHPEVSLVLMDLKMPELDGFEATRQIKAFRKNLSVIAVTAFAMPGDRERAIAAGCDDYLSKPFSSAVLISKLSEYIRL